MARVKDILVLCYHAVSDGWPAELAIQPARLERQLSALMRRGYRGATFTQAVTAPTPGRTLAVTFDDAYRSVLDAAFPILARLGLRATVFVPTAFVDAGRPLAWPGVDQWLGGPYEPELACMSREELRRLAGAGWEIGSHTHSHPRLSSLSHDRVVEELTSSRSFLEEALDMPCRSIAYPYGDADDGIAAAARRVGYAAAAGLEPYQSRPDPLLWPRVGIYRGNSPLWIRLKVSHFARRAGLGRAHRALAALRRGP